MADGVEDVPDGAGAVETGAGAVGTGVGAVGTGAGAVGTGAGAVGAGTGTVGTGAVTVGVGSGSVTDVMVGSVGGSRASAGPTSVAVVATATAKHTIDRALRIPLYNPHRPPRVTLRGQRKFANCNFFAGSDHEVRLSGASQG